MGAAADGGNVLHVIGDPRDGGVSRVNKDRVKYRQAERRMAADSQ